MQGDQQRRRTVCQPMREPNQRLDNIINTLRLMDSTIVSAGTLYCLQSTLFGMISTIQYSSNYSFWPTGSRETIVALLEEGVSCLTKNLANRESEGIHMLSQCVLSLAHASLLWKVLFLEYSVPALVAESFFPELNEEEKIVVIIVKE